MELIFGVVVSLAAQVSKKILGTGEYQTLATVAVLAIAAAALQVFLVHAGYFDSVKEILLTAGAFYTFILARFK